MKPELIPDPGGFALVLPAGDVDGIAESNGLDADGYFWEGVVRALAETKAPEALHDVTFTSDAFQFVAEAGTEEPLAKLQSLLTGILADVPALRTLVNRTNNAEFED